MQTIEDVRKCPNCGTSERTYEYSTDEIEFNPDNNYGHYIVDCHCEKCNTNFRLYMNFKYEITDAHCR